MTNTERLVLKTLAAKPFFRPAMGPALVAVLDRHCVSDEHRRRVCEAAIEMRFGTEDRMEDRCPGPAELKELCAEVPRPRASREALPDCEFCKGTGFEVTPSGARRCRCGGFPMSSESRAEQYRREKAARTPEERAEYSREAAEFAAEFAELFGKTQPPMTRGRNGR